MDFQAAYGPYGLVSIGRKPKQILMDVMQEILADRNIPSQPKE